MPVAVVKQCSDPRNMGWSVYVDGVLSACFGCAFDANRHVIWLLDEGMVGSARISSGLEID